MNNPAVHRRRGLNKGELHMVTTYTIETLNDMPLWMLCSFCREWRVTLVIDNGKIVEMEDDQYE